MTDTTRTSQRASGVATDVPPVVVVGASAGGVTALEHLVRDLPHDFPAAVLVVLHLNPSGVSLLPEILGRAGSLPTAPAVDGEPLRAGTVRVAPPDHHLYLTDGRLVVDRGPQEHGHRPAIDRLFRSAAHSHGPAAVGVLLSGMLDDGVWGLDEIRRAGGTAIAQEPSEARFAALPTAAIDAEAVDLVLGVGEMATEIERLVRTLVANGAERELLDVPRGEPDVPELFTCPSCGGPMDLHAQRHDGEIFRCHTGHVYSSATLSLTQRTKVEEAMWGAYRSLREEGALSRRIASRLDPDSTRRSRHLRRAEIAERRADVLHELLTQPGDGDPADVERALDGDEGPGPHAFDAADVEAS